MKRTCLILVAACIILGSTACSSKNTETTAAETTVAAGESEAQEEEGKETSAEDKEDKGETKEKAEETTKEETTAAPEKEAVTGRVIKIEKTVITVSGQDDLEYQFEIKDAETKSDLEIGEGDEIQVVFLDDDDAKVKQAESYNILTSMALVGDMDPVITGIVQSADDGSVTIETGGGKTYRFSTAIAQIVDGGEGINAGEYAEVTYMGSPSEEKALRVVMEKASGDAEATYYALNGTVAQASDTSVTITAADGTAFTFSLGENVFATDFEAGEEVEIIYEGSLTNNNAVAVTIDYA